MLYDTLFLMSKSIQDIFQRLQEKRQQVKIVKRKYKEELAASSEYQRVADDLTKLREKKKQYEKVIKEQATANFARIDELSLAIKQDAQLLSDVALTTIMKGEPVALKHEAVEYEPIFSVKFRKMK